MDKIIFEDLPSEETPINAANLNQMQDNTEEAIQSIRSLIQDTDWQLLTLSSGFRLYDNNDSSKVRCRRIGNIAEIRGSVTPTTNIASGGSGTIFTLPENYRPKHQLFNVCQGSGVNKWLMSINPDTGAVDFARYGAGSSAACNAGTWLPFHFIYII